MGQILTHWGSLKSPSHSVHFFASIKKWWRAEAAPAAGRLIAWLGQSGSQAQQLTQVSMIS
jgi:hypothetical protein